MEVPKHEAGGQHKISGKNKLWTLSMPSSSCIFVWRKGKAQNEHFLIVFLPLYFYINVDYSVTVALQGLGEGDLQITMLGISYSLDNSRFFTFTMFRFYKIRILGGVIVFI